MSDPRWSVIIPAFNGAISELKRLEAALQAGADIAIGSRVRIHLRP